MYAAFTVPGRAEDVARDLVFRGTIDRYCVIEVGLDNPELDCYSLAADRFLGGTLPLV